MAIPNGPRLGLLQMVPELDTERYASEDARPKEGGLGLLHTTLSLGFWKFIYVCMFSLNTFRKDGVWVSHLLSGYSLPMEDPKLSNGNTSDKSIGGSWKQSIKASYEATTSAFPGGEIIAHLDHK